jgi:hypothetical protein
MRETRSSRERIRRIVIKIRLGYTALERRDKLRAGKAQFGDVRHKFVPHPATNT